MEVEEEFLPRFIELLISVPNIIIRYLRADIKQWDAIQSGFRNRKIKVENLGLSDINFAKADDNFYMCFKLLPFILKIELSNLEMTGDLWDKLFVAFSNDEIKTKDVILNDISINEDNMKQIAFFTAKIQNVVFNNIEVLRKDENFWNSMLNCIETGICGIKKLKLTFLQIYDKQISGLSKLISRIKHVEFVYIEMDKGQWEVLLEELKKNDNDIKRLDLFGLEGVYDETNILIAQCIACVPEIHLIELGSFQTEDWKVFGLEIGNRNDRLRKIEMKDIEFNKETFVHVMTIIASVEEISLKQVKISDPFWDDLIDILGKENVKVKIIKFEMLYPDEEIVKKLKALSAYHLDDDSGLAKCTFNATLKKHSIA